MSTDGSNYSSYTILLGLQHACLHIMPSCLLLTAWILRQFWSTKIWHVYFVFAYENAYMLGICTGYFCWSTVCDLQIVCSIVTQDIPNSNVLFKQLSGHCCGIVVLANPPFTSCKCCYSMAVGQSQHLYILQTPNIF